MKILRDVFGITPAQVAGFYLGVKFGALITTAIFVAAALFFGGGNG